MIVIAGGLVLTTEGWQFADVLIDGAVVESIGEHLSAGQVIDATGCLVGPAFVDLHTHLREPGHTWKEDIASGSRAAVAGGFGAVVAMPNTDPALDNPKFVEMVAAIGDEVGLVDVIPSGALTVARDGVLSADIQGMYESGVRIFTDDGDSVADATLLRQIMAQISGLPGAVVAQHAEDAAKTAGGHMNEGVMSRRLGVVGLPAEAEIEVVKRDIELAAATGARYHCQHVSARMTVDVLRAAKRQGLAVTAEVTPHHLSFDETALESLNTDFKMYPPLRSAEDRAALVAGLEDRTIDVVATDHAPHTPAEKDVAFTEAPRGVIGLETAAAAVWEVCGNPALLFEVLSSAPARIAAAPTHGSPIEPGGLANLVAFDPQETWIPDTFASRSSNSPYRGRVMKGRVRATFRRGELVYQNGVITR